MERIGELIGKSSFWNDRMRDLDAELLKNPKQYWESVFPELLAADLPIESYDNQTSLRLLNIKADQEKCVGCTGYESCRKDEDQKGYQFSIGMTELGIVEQITHCDFYKASRLRHQEKRLIDFSGLNDGHRRMTFENFPDEQKKQNKDLCKKAFQFANEYVPNSDIKGLYIYGGVGTAKTHLACAILNRMIQRHLRVHYMQAEKTFAAMADLYFRENRDGLPTRSEILDKYISADVLVIDELGHENMNESSIWALYTILNGREPERKPIIVTSNFSLGKLTERYLSRTAGESSRRAEALLSRLMWLTKDYEMIGEDFRSRHFQDILPT